MAYIGNIPAEAYTNTVKDSFNGNGSTTAFTLSRPTVTNDVRVVVENVIQDPTVAYSVSGTTLTFTSAPPAGTGNIYVVHLGPAVMTAIPPSEIADATTFASSVTVQGAFTSLGIDDNATSTAMTLDSSGLVGIGTSSPARLAEIYGTTNPALRLNNGTANVDIGIATAAGALLSGSSSNDLVIARNGAYNIKLGTNGTTRMTLDASGNVLVGKTSIGLSTTGIDLRSTGLLQAIRNGGTVVELNRQTSNGTIIDFRKDNATVGSIGSVVGSYLSIGQGDTGILFQDDNDFIEPCNVSTSTGRDAAIDLGTAGGRFKDLYLSGGVYLGGTGASNKLDDYEEGTWTATLDFATSSGSLNYVNNTLRYCKVGNLVFISGNVNWNANNYTANTGSLRLEGLPFRTTTDNRRRGGVSISYSSQPWTGLTIYQQAFREEIADNHLIFSYSNAADGRMDSEVGSYTSINSAGAIFLSGCYFTE